MAPPPVTPSPHRFVIKKQKNAPQSHQPPSLPTAHQFNATPRFHFAPSQRSSVSDALYREETPLAHQYSTPARPRDVIEDPADVADCDIHESVESAGPEFGREHLSADEDDDYGLRLRSSKRRRLSPSPILDSQDQYHLEQQDEETVGNFHKEHNDVDHFISSANSAISSPSIEPPNRQPSSTAAPRFILPSTPARIPSSTPATTQVATFMKPPRFRPPDDQEQQQQIHNEPLPDAFSPQRRGQKFLAGGLASEVIRWIMNLESSTHLNSPARSNEDRLVTELLVDEVRGGPSAGMTLVSGRHVGAAQNGQGGMVDALGGVKVILAGSGTADGFQRASKVDVKKKIRIKSPVWEVSIEGEKWGVAVTWEVLG